MLILPGWNWVPSCIGASLGVYSILQLVDRILRSALVFVLDIKLLQRNHTWLRWSELYDTSMELQIMVCGIQKTQMLALLGIQMQTGLVVWTIERVLQEVASSLVTILSRGWARNKIPCLSLAARSYCTQLLWMKKLLHDYEIPQDTMCVFCDNTSAINLSKNPVQHSKSKHIEIRYHFIQDLVEERVVCLEFIYTDNQRRISSPSLSMVHGLNPSVKPLVLVQSLESLMWCVLHLFILCYFVCGSHTSLLAICIAWSYWLLITLSVFAVFTLLLLINPFFYVSKIQKPHKK